MKALQKLLCCGKWANYDYYAYYMLFSMASESVKSWYVIVAPSYCRCSLPLLLPLLACLWLTSATTATATATNTAEGNTSCGKKRASQPSSAMPRHACLRVPWLYCLASHGGDDDESYCAPTLVVGVVAGRLGTLYSEGCMVEAVGSLRLTTAADRRRSRDDGKRRQRNATQGKVRRVGEKVLWLPLFSACLLACFLLAVQYPSHFLGLLWKVWSRKWDREIERGGVGNTYTVVNYSPVGKVESFGGSGNKFVYECVYCAIFCVYYSLL